MQALTILREDGTQWQPSCGQTVRKTSNTPKKTRSPSFTTSTNRNRRVKLAEQHNWQCWWCNQTLRREMGWQNSATIEHVVCLSAGGPDEAWNRVAACWRCNTTRGVENSETFAKRACTFECDTRTVEEALRVAKKSKQKSKRIEKQNQFIAAKAARRVPVPHLNLQNKNLYKIFKYFH